MTKRIAVIAAVCLAFGATSAVAVALWRSSGESDHGPNRGALVPAAEPPTPSVGPVPASRTANGTEGRGFIPPPAPGPLDFALRPLDGALPVHHPFKHPPAAGVLFDVRTGRVLWQRHPRLELPVASLTKMMTALIVARRDRPGARVRISRKAAHTPGSATGLLPRGRKVPLQPLLQALIMISANDAAVALAQHDAGSVTRFVKGMNREADAMELHCTHFSTPNGLRDRNNYSCPIDLAALARADLAEPRIARIAQTRYAKPRFPIKGKHLYLYNNHYFLQRGLAGLPQAQVTGLKTGFTDRAGRCYVTTARIGGRELGVVLLRSPNPLVQVPALLRAGFVADGMVPLPPPHRSGHPPVD